MDSDLPPLAVSDLPPLDDKVKPVAVEWAADAVRAWAESHGLEYAPLGMLPGLTPALAAGHGVGTHRASVVTHETFNARGGGRREAHGGWTKRPERSFANLCSGVLPGGEEGVLANVVSMEMIDMGSDADAWGCVTRTVAAVRVPEAMRVVRNLDARAGGPAEVKALISFGKAPTPPESAPGVLRAFGWSWVPSPAEDLRVLEAALVPAAGVLAGLPEHARIEVREGTVAVVARPAITDAGALDAMARTASLLAAGLRAVAAEQPELRPGDRWEPELDATLIAAAEGAARISWDGPPASLAAAREAYAATATRTARKVGRGLGKLVAAATWVTPLAIDGPGGPSVAARDRSRGNLWALSAFTAEYARSRGLAEVDRDEFRRRLPDAPAGMPLRVLEGRLASGARGWVALWLDKTDLAAEPAYGIYARTADGLSAFCPVTPETLTPERIDEVGRAVRASAPVLA